MSERDSGDANRRHFSDLQVWQRAHELFVDVAGDIDSWPDSRSSRILSDQILRSIGSISANLAEGYNQSARRFYHCINVAVGKANETENWLYKVRDCELMGAEKVKAHLRNIIEIRKMLIGLKRAVDERSETAGEPEPDYGMELTQEHNNEK